eukprot:g13875.t2
MLDNWAKREGSSPQKLEFTEFVHIHVLMARVAPEGAEAAPGAWGCRRVWLHFLDADRPSWVEVWGAKALGRLGEMKAHQSCVEVPAIGIFLIMDLAQRRVAPPNEKGGWGHPGCKDHDDDVDRDDLEMLRARLARHFFTGRPLDRRACRRARLQRLQKRFQRRPTASGDEALEAQSPPADSEIRREAVSLTPRGAASAHGHEMLSSTVTGKATEEEHDYWPIFILLQALLALSLWVMGASQERETLGRMILSAKAGLDTLLPGRTNMATHKDCEDLRWQIWRWLTYQYTHFGLSHIILNVVMILMVGIRLEMYHGHWRTCVIFNLGVICAAFNFAVIDGHASLIGMSGGVYALMGMTFGSLILNWHDTRYRRPELLVLLMLFVLDLAFAYVSASPDNETSHSAHFGGYASGVVLGVLMGRNLDEEEAQQHAKTLRGERILQAVLASIGAVVLLCVTAWMLQWPPRKDAAGKTATTSRNSESFRNFLR